MSKSRLAGLICIFAAVVLVVLAFALPVYKTAPKIEDYNGKDAVIAGSDGFLFYAYTEKYNALSGFRGDGLYYSKKELSAYVSALTSLSKQLSDKGCDTVFVFVPSKMSVYRNKLPENIRDKFSSIRRYTQLFNALSGEGEDVIDLFPYFDAVKNNEQLYHTTSDEINDVGGYRLFEQTARHINEIYKKNIKIYELSDYEAEISFDISYPLTREYRNITGGTVPNRTVELKEKTVFYKDTGYDYEATAATQLPEEYRIESFDYPSFMIFDGGASSSCRKFFSASSSLSVFRRGYSADEVITDRANPEFAVIIISEDEMYALPSEAQRVDINDEISAEPLIKATAYSDAEHFVIFGNVEPESTVYVTGGAENINVYTEDGEFVIEAPLYTDTEYTVFELKCKTYGKAESSSVRLEAEYSDMNGNKGVVIGKDGHLHYQETIPDFTGESALTEEVVSQYVGYLSAKADAIHEVSPDTKIIYVVPPNHLTVYPETAPDSLLAQRSDVTRLTQLIEAFKDSDKLTFLDLRTPLLQAKENAPYRLYNKTDTHWNELGAYYAYRQIMDVISVDFPAAAPDPLEEFDVFSKTVSGGDMANFLEVDLNVVTEKGVYVRAKNGLQSGISKDYSMNFANAWFSDQREFKIDNKELPTMIMYRDSFSTNLMSFLAEKFSCSIFHTMWEYPDELELYKQLQPDYIIIERVERSLSGL